MTPSTASFPAAQSGTSTSSSSSSPKSERIRPPGSKETIVMPNLTGPEVLPARLVIWKRPRAVPQNHETSNTFHTG